MDVWTFMDANPVLTFFLAFPITATLIICAAFSFKILNRLLRTIKVCVRGWPPEHLDADGDYLPRNIC